LRVRRFDGQLADTNDGAFNSASTAGMARRAWLLGVSMM